MTSAGAPPPSPWHTVAETPAWRSFWRCRRWPLHKPGCSPPQRSRVLMVPPPRCQVSSPVPARMGVTTCRAWSRLALAFCQGGLAPVDSSPGCVMPESSAGLVGPGSSPCATSVNKAAAFRTSGQASVEPVPSHAEFKQRWFRTHPPHTGTENCIARSCVATFHAGTDGAVGSLQRHRTSESIRGRGARVAPWPISAGTVDRQGCRFRPRMGIRVSPRTLEKPSCPRGELECRPGCGRHRRPCFGNGTS